MSHLAGQQLGQLRPANTTAASIFSPGSGETGHIKGIFICNLTALVVKYRLFVDDDGSTFDETTALFFDIEIKANATHVLKLSGFEISMDDETGNFGVRTDTNNALNFTLFGGIETTT